MAASTRIVASKAGDSWMRIMTLAPSASTSMSVTVLGDANMTLLSALFVKPQAVVVMGFSDDPQAGLTADRFSGSAHCYACDAVLRIADSVAALKALSISSGRGEAQSIPNACI